MFLKKLFFKPNFIAFYQVNNTYKLLNEQYKKETIFFSETKEFDNEKDLKKYIKSVIDDNPQTYVSNLIFSQNQGVVPSCDKRVYKEIGINLENITSICINNKYSFYTTIYELMEIKKNYPFIDFLYPVFAVIDFKSSIRHNALYVLVTDDYSYVLIFKDNLPFFADIFDIKEEEFLDDDDEDEEEGIEDITGMDIIEEEFDDSLDENIEEVDETEIEQENIEHLNVEYKIIEYIKTALKEYYESDGDFVEKIFIFDTIGMQKNITNIINDEIFIESSIENLDILKTINDMSRKNV